jgi:hypothetical protein
MTETYFVGREELYEMVFSALHDFPLFSPAFAL